MDDEPPLPPPDWGGRKPGNEVALVETVIAMFAFVAFLGWMLLPPG